MGITPMRRCVALREGARARRRRSSLVGREYARAGDGANVKATGGRLMPDVTPLQRAGLTTTATMAVLAWLRADVAGGATLPREATASNITKVMMTDATADARRVERAFMVVSGGVAGGEQEAASIGSFLSLAYEIDAPAPNPTDGTNFFFRRA